MRDDYAPEAPGIFAENTGTRAEAAKRALAQLETSERVLFILHAELASVRDLAALLGVTRSTLGDELVRIKRKLFDLMRKENETDA